MYTIPYTSEMYPVLRSMRFLVMSHRSVPRSFGAVVHIPRILLYFQLHPPLACHSHLPTDFSLAYLPYLLGSLPSRLRLPFQATPANPVPCRLTF